MRKLDLDVCPGTALGILGANGTGKSTLLRLILGHVRPTTGQVRVTGEVPAVYVRRHGIGYVPEAPAIPPRWTVRGALQAFAALSHLPDGEYHRIDLWLDRLGLAPVAGRRVGELSKGQRQRLIIAQALLADRKILVLDEPFHGLDPYWRERMREIVADWRAEDAERMLLIASHDIAEIEHHADRAVILAGGRVRADLDLREYTPPEHRESPLEAAYRRVMRADGDGEAPS